MKEKTFGNYRAVFTSENETIIVCPTSNPDLMRPHQAEIIIEDLRSCLLWLRDQTRRAHEEQTPELFR